MVTETAANGIKSNQRYSVFSPFAISDEKQCAWSSSTVMEVNGKGLMLGVNLFLPRVLYLPKCAIISRSWTNTARRHKIWK